MKNLFILLLSLVALSTTAQIVMTPVAGTKVLNDKSYVYYWGASTDTLVASDNISIDLRLPNIEVSNIVFGLQMTKISGTVTNTFVFYKSIDGVNYITTGDTITYTNASSGVTLKSISDYTYPYIRLVGTAGATAQKAKYKLIAIRNEE